MEEIRIKLWLHHTKKMTYDHDLQQIIDLGWDLKGTTPLLFTGLKVKNTKIFQGDICKIWFGEDDGTDEMRGVVTYQDGRWKLKRKDYPEDDRWNLDEWYKASTFKVLGNVYENPELLQENQ